jgi:hypothetical protein
VPRDGFYTLEFRHAFGGTSDVARNLLVDGVAIRGAVTVPNLFSGQVWGTERERVELPAGTTVLTFTGDRGDETIGIGTEGTGVAIDSLTVTECGHRLTGAEYRAIVFGNTLDRQLPNGSRLSIHVGPDGTQRLRLVGVGGQAGSDQGSQEIRGNQVCSTWTRIGNGQPSCFAYFQLDASLIAVDVSGRLQPSRFQLLTGSPIGI